MKLHVKFMDEGRGVTYGDVDKFQPATHTVPFWTIWFKHGRQSIFLPHHAVKALIVEEEGDQSGSVS